MPGEERRTKLITSFAMPLELDHENELKGNPNDLPHPADEPHEVIYFVWFRRLSKTQ
jgi:hypothetical protein